jgi:hypothetical protein
MRSCAHNIQADNCDVVAWGFGTFVGLVIVVGLVVVL